MRSMYLSEQTYMPILIGFSAPLFKEKKIILVHGVFFFKDVFRPFGFQFGQKSVNFMTYFSLGFHVLVLKIKFYSIFIS